MSQRISSDDQADPRHKQLKSPRAQPSITGPARGFGTMERHVDLELFCMPEHVPDVRISVVTRFLPEQSEPERQRYVFAYQITIANHGEESVHLLNRHWIIKDAREQTQEVRGEGVVGQQPLIAPGDHFEYTSGTMIETPIGIMQGSYEMRTASGMTFEAEIPPFTLSVPGSLH